MRVEGQVLFNNQPLTKKLKRQVGYVTQVGTRDHGCTTTGVTMMATFTMPRCIGQPCSRLDLYGMPWFSMDPAQDGMSLSMQHLG